MNVLRAITAGIIGSVAVDAFLIAAHLAPFPGIYQFSASTRIGPAAFPSSVYILLGLALHFTMSILFAFASTFVARRSRAPLDHPIVSGALFGVS